MDDDYANGADAMAMSQLDVISCGLGGAVLLGLVFSIVGNTAPIETSAPEYVAVEFFMSDRESVVSLLIRPPEYSELELDVDEWFDESGHVRLEKQATSPLRSYGEFQLIVSPREKRTKRDVDEDGIPQEYDCVTVLVGAPVGGKWSFNVRFTDQSEEKWSQLMSQPGIASPEPLTIWRRFETRLTSSKDIQKVANLKFGWTTNRASAATDYGEVFQPIAVAEQGR